MLLLVAPARHRAPRTVALLADLGAPLAFLVLPAAVIHAPAAFHVSLDVDLAATVSLLASCARHVLTYLKLRSNKHKKLSKACTLVLSCVTSTPQPEKAMTRYHAAYAINPGHI